MLKLNMIIFRENIPELTFEVLKTAVNFRELDFIKKIVFSLLFTKVCYDYNLT